MRNRLGRRLLTAVGLIGVLALMAVGCGGDDDDDGDGGAPPEAETTEPIQVTLPFPDSIFWVGYEVSRGADGPYEVNYGLEPESEATEGGSFVIQQLIAGNIDHGISGVPEVLVANAQGNELLGIAVITSDIFTIQALADSDVTSIEDLEGERLGVTDLGGGEIPLVNAALDGAGLSENDVELVPVGAGGARAKNALESGQIAAYAGGPGDFPPLENAGLDFEPIIGEEFADLPADVMVIRPELADDQEQLDNVLNLMKGWYEGVLYADQFTEDGLARACDQAPEDCQDAEFAQGFFDASIGLSLDQAEACGAVPLDRLEKARDSIAAVDVPEAADVDVSAAFPDTYHDQMCPDQEVVDQFAERTGATAD